MYIKNKKNLLIIFFSILFFSTLSFFTPINYLVNFAHDDSFFYLKIAQNIVNGLGITFDTISTTNGFHPLYLIVITLLFFILKLFGITSSEAQYISIFIFHIILLHVIIIISLKILKRKLDEKYFKYGMSIFIIFCLSFVFIRDFGIESHLSCLLMSFFLLNNINNGKPKKRIVYNSLIISGLFLCRTDYLFTLIPFLILSAILITNKDTRVFSAISYILILFITTSVYYLINYFYWGHFQTTSGALINAFPIPVLINNLDMTIVLHFKLYNQGVKILLFLFIFVIFITRKNKSQLEILLIFISSGLLFNCIMHLMFNVYGLREWYMTHPLFVISFMLILLLEKYNSIIRNLALYIFILLFLLVFYFSRISALKWEYALDYAEYLKNNTPKEDIIYQFDMSGIISFFSDRYIIDGDGLVSDFNYISFLKNRKINLYLKEHKVKYLSTIKYSEDLFSPEGKFIFRQEESPLDNIILYEKDLEHKHNLTYKHVTGYYYGYYLLFNISK